jgi:hypothetical protein
MEVPNLIRTVLLVLRHIKNIHDFRMEHPSNGNGIDAVIRRNPADGTVSIEGKITGLQGQPITIAWSAAAPVTRGISFAGSGQPYPNREIAFENTPNKGSIESTDGSFNLSLSGIPAGYYTGLGSVYVPPMVEFNCIAKKGTTTFQTSLWINDTAVPYRWLNGGPATLRPELDEPGTTGRSMYYFGREQMPLFVNQEAQLRAKGYPGDMVGRGWPESDDAKPWTRVPPPS